MNAQGAILRVDLTTQNISREPIPEELRRKYLGGEGINSWLLWQHFLKVDPRIDPLSPDNVLILGAGPLCGTGLGAGSKMRFTFKSPAYNMYGDTSCSGLLAAQLRWAGYDHVVITGRSKTPVYFWVTDDSVELRDASRLRGKGFFETEAAIGKELGDPEVVVAGIGQAGENLVRVASVIATGHRAAGRGGCGCVFGSKNLKAIAAHGTQGLRIHDPVAFFQAIDEFLKERRKGSERQLESMMRYGTLTNLRGLHGLGISNFHNGSGRQVPEEGLSRLDQKYYSENMGVRPVACSPGCAFGCGGWYHIKGESPSAKRYAGEWGTKPEFGAVHPIGSGCGILDLEAVSHINELCNDYGMDTFETGMAIAFLMELWERKIITSADTAEWNGEPLALDWGNYESAEKIIESMALQNNALGKILQGGVYQAALRIGELKGTDLLKYANYGKGGSTHTGAARPWPALGLACALAPIGAHHLKGMGIGPANAVKYFGAPDAASAFGTKLKGPSHAIAETLSAITNSLGVCHFILGREAGAVTLKHLARYVGAVTGMNFTEADLYSIGERVANIQKAFNSRLGLRREQDTLCHRWMNEPYPEGPVKGMMGSVYLETAKDEYYEYRGWDKKTGLQTEKKLEELQITDVAAVLKKEHALA